MPLDYRAAFAGVAFSFIWSSAFSAARIIVAEAPPLSALALRFAFTGLLAILVARLLGQSMRFTGGQWRAAVIFGLCQNSIYIGLNFVAMQWIEASLAAIIASSVPLLVAAVNRVVYGERIGVQGVIGLAVGFAGVAIILGAKLDGGTQVLGAGLCILGAIALCLATLAVRNTAADGNLLMFVGMQMLVGSAGLVLPALILEELDVQWSWQLATAMSYSIIFPGLLGTWLWIWLVGRVGPTRSATYHFLNPCFGVAVAAAVLGESMTFRDMVGVVIVMAGILTVQYARQGKGAG